MRPHELQRNLLIESRRSLPSVPESHHSQYPSASRGFALVQFGQRSGRAMLFCFCAMRYFSGVHETRTMIYIVSTYVAETVRMERSLFAVLALVPESGASGHKQRRR